MWQTDAERMRTTVELEIASEPVRGSLDDGAGSAIELAGWSSCCRVRDGRDQGSRSVDLDGTVDDPRRAA